MNLDMRVAGRKEGWELEPVPGWAGCLLCWVVLQNCYIEGFCSLIKVKWAKRANENSGHHNHHRRRRNSSQRTTNQLTSHYNYRHRGGWMLVV